ncbi:MAG: HEPN domain-containing protein [Saprospiraceae bacterium]|nr:HEPN domain-containing protein [Saprospiraceae bacterium]
MSFSKQELVKYRIARAKEVFEDAEILVERKRWNSAANRMYYACFYIVSAYLAQKGQEAATHSGLKSAFNQELIKSGKIDPSEGILFNKLFGMRQDADYEDFTDSEESELLPLLPKIKSLIEDIENLINKNQSTQ